MSFVVAAPELVASAASDLASLGSSVRAATAASAAHTTSVAAAAGDEVSAAIAALFSGHAQRFQAASAQAAAFHAEFVQALKGAGSAYAAAEAANGSPLAAFDKAVQGVQQEIQQIQTTLTAGFNQELNSLLSSPSSPLLKLFTGNIPGLSLFLSNSPPKALTLLLGESVQHTTYDGMSVVQITPAHPSGDYVVAIHGGAFIFAPSIFHWLNYTITAYQTGATFEVPIYPLLQQGGTAGTVVPQIAGLISTQIAQHGPAQVSVIGDSAGGTLALAAVESMAANQEAVPGSMVLLSPWLDPGQNGGQIGEVWAGNLPINDYRVSPLYGSLSGLPPTYVYSGSADPLATQALALQQKAVAQGIPMSFFVANGQNHDWVLLTPDGLQYWPQIDQELGIAP